MYQDYVGLAIRRRLALEALHAVLNGDVPIEDLRRFVQQIHPGRWAPAPNTPFWL